MVYVYIHTHTHTYIYMPFLLYSSVDGHLVCFHVLAVVNSAATNIGVHVSFRIRVFIFSGYMPRSGLVSKIPYKTAHTTQCQKNKQLNQKMGRRAKYIFLQRRHTDGQQAHEKMLNITNYLRNANHNYRLQ